MAENLSEVNWFKFALVIFMAATTSMMFNLEDGYIEYVEIWRTMVYADRGFCISAMSGE